MTITVTSVANTQSFGAWLSTTNRLVEIVSQNTVTVDTSTGGSLSTGNGYVNGYFGANYLYVANGLSGGNVSSNGVLDIVSNVAFKYSTSNLVTLTANSTESVLNINVTNVNITANTISITGNTSFSNAVNFSDAVTFANAVNMTSTSPSVFSSNVTVSGTVSVGNSTVNTTINSTAFGISNSTVSYSILAPTAAQYANNDYYLNANGQWSRVVTGSNTYIQFNDSETLGSSSSLTFNKTTSTLNVGTFTANSTVVNSTAYNIGSNFIANSTGVYTGTVNAASHTVGTSTIANATGVFTTGTVNGATISVGTSTIANATGVYTGVVNGSSITVGTSTIANATGVFTTGTVNGSSITVGTSTIANATGVYTGVVNGSSITVGTSVIANTTRLAIGTAVGLQANGGIGTTGQILTSNGTTVYWSTPSAGVAGSTTQIQFNDGGVLAGDTGLTFNKTTDTLSTNTILATSTVNAASHTVGTSTIANATGVFTTGTVNGATISIGASVIANTTRLAIGTAVGVQANGGIGTAGQVLTSNGTTVYWGSAGASGTVTSVATGNGLTGGPITTTGTVSILANSGVTANTTGLFVTQGTGLVVNATGVHLNATYIGTLAANSATYLGSVNNLGNATGIYITGTVNAASHTVGTSTIANTTGVFTTGTVNGATISVGTSVIANTTRLAIGTAVGLQANGGIGAAGEVLHSNGTSIYWAPDDQGVTSVATGNGLTGGPITTTGTVSILANSGITANSTGLFVTQGTGTVVNATGVHVNATYIGTLAANSATYLGSSINFGNASGIFTTGTVNGATISVGTSVIANTTRLVIGTAVGLQANGGIGTSGQVLTSNGTTIYWAGAGVAVTANNTDTQTFFIPMSNSTTGTWSNGVVSNTKLYFVPSTGTLNATIFNSLSDREQKINIVTAPVGFIDAIRGVEYDWKDTGKKSSGVIAQEIEEYLPHLVETKDGSKSVNYSGLIAYLIEEIKQLKDRVKALENK